MAGQLFPPPGRAATVLVILREDPTTLPVLQRSRPDGEVVWTLADGYGRPYAAAYRLPPAENPAPAPGHPAGAVWGDAIQLLGHSLDTDEVAAGETLQAGSIAGRGRGGACPVIQRSVAPNQRVDHRSIRGHEGQAALELKERNIELGIWHYTDVTA